MGIDCSNCFSSNKKAQTNSTLLVRAADDQISFGKIPSHLEKSHLQRAMTTPVSTSHPQKQKKVTLEMFKFLKVGIFNAFRCNKPFRRSVKVHMAKFTRCRIQKTGEFMH